MTRDSWIENEGTLIDAFDSLTGWARTSGSGILSLDPYHYQSSDASIRIEHNTADQDTYIEKTVSLNLAGLKTLQLRVFVHATDDTGLQSNIVRVAFFTNNISPYKFIEETWVYLHPGWNTLYTSRDLMSAYNGIDLENETVVKIRVGVFSGSGSILSLSFDEVRMNVENKPICLLTFDDGRKTVATNALPIMQELEAEHGIRIPATMYLCKLHADLGEGGNTLYLTYAQIQALKDAGWTIANHTLTHPDLLKITDGKIITEVQGMADWLIAQGHENGAHHLAYPHGHGGPTIYAALSQCGILSARIVSGGNWQTAAHYRYKTIANTSLGVGYLSVADAKTAMLHAKDYGEICVFTIHGVQTIPTTEELTPTEYRELLEYGIELGMIFLKIDELIDGMAVDDVQQLGGGIQVAIKGEAATINYLAWATAHGEGMTGDSANHAIKLILDGSVSTPTNDPAEVDATDAPGIYSLALTSAEMNHNTISVVGRSSSPNVIIVPVHIATQSYHIMGSSTYTDTVVDSDGDPIAGAQVEIYSDSDRTTLVDVQISDINGSITSHLNPGTYYLRGIKAGYTIPDWAEVVA